MSCTNHTSLSTQFFQLNITAKKKRKTKSKSNHESDEWSKEMNRQTGRLKESKNGVRGVEIKKGKLNLVFACVFSFGFLDMTFRRKSGVD